MDFKIKNAEEKVRTLQKIESVMQTLRTVDMDAVPFDLFVELNQIKLDYYDYLSEERYQNAG